MTTNDTQTKGGVGRTAWDFATELLVVLGRIGPAAIIVAGVLVAGYFFYTEVNRARLDADVQLQQKLTVAQDQLIQTYEKMSSMSDQLIGNISSLMELNSTINSQIDDARGRLGELSQKLEDAERLAASAQQARQSLELRNAEMRQRQEETQQTLAMIEARKKKLEVELREFEEKRQQAEQALSERTKQIEQQNQRIADLERQLGALSPDTPEPADVAQRGAQLAEALTRFAADPASMTPESFDRFIGMKLEEVETVVKAGLGFGTWDREYNIIQRDGAAERSLSGIVGVSRPLEIGDGPYISFDISDNLVSDVRIGGGYVVTRMPQAENWYADWYAALVVSEDNLRGTYFESSAPLKSWTVSQVFTLMGNAASESIYGTQASYRVLDLKELSKEFPSHFDAWSKERDAYGRPSLVLRMVERATSYSAATMFSADKFDAAFDKSGRSLYEAFVALADALVKRDIEAIESRLAPSLFPVDRGVAAAILLRDNCRVEEVNKLEELDGSKSTGMQVEVVLTFDGIDPTQPRQRALFDFSLRDGAWRMDSMWDWY